jgi:hypothetical protein
MNVGASLIPHSQSTVLVEPAQRAFHHPSIDAQAASVWCAALGKMRAHPALTQFLSMPLRIICPIPIEVGDADDPACRAPVGSRRPAAATE